MSFLGMTIATINQRFSTPPAGLVLGLKFGQVFYFDGQIQVGTHLLKDLARLNALQQAFQTLGLLTHGWGMGHQNLLTMS